MSEILPIDLIDHILSFLRSDTDTLKACTKSHPILSDLSERYIYANVVLRDDIYDIFTPTDLRTSEFIQILAEKSAIANHVRSLEVVCVVGDSDSGQHEVTSSHLDGVASLLPMLAGLSKFMLRGSLDNDGCFPWHSIPETFRQAFPHHLHAQDIVIRHISFFPMAVLKDCRNFRISLEHCDEIQYDVESANSKNALQSYPLPFEHLSVTHCSNLHLENLAAWVHGLRSLKYGAYVFNSSLQQLFVACSSSLTSLHLDVSRSHSIDTPYQVSNNSAIPNAEIARFPFTLASLHHLTQLRFMLGRNYHSGGIWSLESPIPAILELLSTARPTLTQVSIELDFSFTWTDYHPPDTTAIWCPFIPLAAKCSSSSITMYIHPSFDIPPSKKEISQSLFTHLADYKGLTTYVQSSVVVISKGMIRTLLYP